MTIETEIYVVFLCSSGGYNLQKEINDWIKYNKDVIIKEIKIIDSTECFIIYER